MKHSAIYCRVSSEDQEREGTSLQTQLKACVACCQQKGSLIAHRFGETHSGSTLERPKLNEFKQQHTGDNTLTQFTVTFRHDKSFSALVPHLDKLINIQQILGSVYEDR